MSVSNLWYFILLLATPVAKVTATSKPVALVVVKLHLSEGVNQSVENLNPEVT